MYSFGQILKGLRTERKLSLDQLTKLLNEKYETKISKSMISRYENNLAEPKMEIVRIFADFFEASPDYIMGINSDVNNKAQTIDVKIETIAAHHDNEDWTKEELEEIERFKEFVRAKRNK